ncbi:hypothetical protein F5Y18DRAFT_78006 [Xylariaceae sp. FL1019]|nr:hypothetical protein F5Y18DRAFT_78006 [Xylariaceae sp. FL1019]
MDPLSFTLGIAGVVPLVAATVLKTREFYNAVKERKKAIGLLLIELESLESCLSSLAEMLEREELRGQTSRFNDASVLKRCCSACETLMTELCRKLDEASVGKMSRIKWPLSEKEHEKAMQSIRHFTTWMQLALTIDGCKLLSRTSDDVLEILGQQLQQFNVVESIHSETIALRNSLEASQQLLEDSKESDARQAVLNWISPEKYERKHVIQRQVNVRASRTPETGSWFLEHPLYRQWKRRETPENLLWCPGIQGSGKTILISAAIDDVLEFPGSDRAQVGYVYFDYQSQEDQTPTVVLNSLLRQLVQVLPTIPTAIQDIFSAKSPKTASLSVLECEWLISELARDNGTCYLILDALDESDNAKCRTEIISSIIRLRATPEIRVLVTSRPHTEIIDVALADCPRLNITAHDGDIRTYLRQEIDKQSALQVVDDDFASELLESLLRRADGMFLLPVLQLRTVLREPTQGEMEDALENLSSDLNQTFESTITRIQSLPPSRCRLGLQALMWASHAKRPLTSQELIEVLAVRPNQTKANRKYQPTVRMMLECCQGLLVVDTGTQIVRPAHYSIQEYLTKQTRSLFPDSMRQMASTCLQYLKFSDFAEGPWKLGEDIEHQINTWHFLRYASRYWDKHVQPVEEDPTIIAEIDRYFDHETAPAMTLQVTRLIHGYIKRYWDAEECLSLTTLHHAANHGLGFMLVRCLESGQYDFNAKTIMGSSPLIFAASKDYVQIVRILLDHGANPGYRNWYGDALHCAIEAGCVGAIKEFLAIGMSARAPDYVMRTLDNDAAEAFEFLVDVGIGEKRFLYWWESMAPKRNVFFLLAVAMGCSRIAGVIARRGWANFYGIDDEGRTLLHSAGISKWLNVEIVSELTNAGCDMNVQDIYGKRPLDYMAASDDLATGSVDLSYIERIAESFDRYWVKVNGFDRNVRGSDDWIRGTGPHGWYAGAQLETIRRLDQQADAYG